MLGLADIMAFTGLADGLFRWHSGLPALQVSSPSLHSLVFSQHYTSQVSCCCPQVLQTSSPSYLLLSSLDAARRHAFSPGVWLTPLAAASSAREQLAVLPGLLLMQDGNCATQQSAAGFDPLRLVVNVQGLHLTGYQAAAWLEEQHGIVPELATNKVSETGDRTTMWLLPLGITIGQPVYGTLMHMHSCLERLHCTWRLSLYMGNGLCNMTEQIML